MYRRAKLWMMPLTNVITAAMTTVRPSMWSSELSDTSMPMAA
jgi:hypothetical protein